MTRFKAFLAAALFAAAPVFAYAEGVEGGPKQTTNGSAISMFIAFVFLTLGIT
jgi:hypothetical protein